MSRSTWDALLAAAIVYGIEPEEVVVIDSLTPQAARNARSLRLLPPSPVRAAANLASKPSTLRKT